MQLLLLQSRLRKEHSRIGTYQAALTTGTSWTLVPGLLKQLDVGRNIVVGVNSENEILYRKDIKGQNPTGLDWVQLDGRLKHVTVSPNGAIWGISPDNLVYFRDGISVQNPAGTSWQQVDGSFTQISAGPSGVWGVNANDDIFYREGTYGGHVTVGSRWTQVEGKLAYITSGSGVVLGVDREEKTYRRTEISEGNPKVYIFFILLDLSFDWKTFAALIGYRTSALSLKTVALTTLLSTPLHDDDDGEKEHGINIDMCTYSQHTDTVIPSQTAGHAMSQSKQERHEPSIVINTPTATHLLTCVEENTTKISKRFDNDRTDR
ncbi:hypothetical protein C0Q70_14245 [Pomacea canaliculata]|uniref:Uncharacterized protein n=1 Tax=Pomacea canaliculata TaxID=400727 RepID=A0A2T7NZH7_POMCA|nr:hypothetical protein C0Q70_14245 [Pomacea canaliculata]